MVVALYIRDKRSLERRIGKLINPQRAEQRISTHAGDQVSTAADQSSLRSSQQFVAAVGYDIHAGAQAIEHAGLAADAELLQVHQSAAAQVFHQGQAMRARARH